MKSIVVYSSLTGNTKMVGEAIAEVLAPNCDIYKVEDNPDITGYDLVAVGFGWTKEQLMQKLVNF